MGGNATKNYVDRHSSGGGGGSGTTNYNELENKPSINGVVLSGNKTSEDLNIGGGGLPDFEHGVPQFLCNFKKGNNNYKIYRMYIYLDTKLSTMGAQYIDISQYMDSLHIFGVFNFSLVGQESNYPAKPQCSSPTNNSCRVWLSPDLRGAVVMDRGGFSSGSIVNGYIDFIANA